MKVSSRLVVVLSGPIASGKTTLAAGLEAELGAHRLTTRDLLLTHVGRDAPANRLGLQELAERLDDESGGAWITDPLEEILRATTSSIVVIDSLRTRTQIGAVRSIVPDVLHVHLVAPLADLEERFRRRVATVEEPPTYDEVRLSVSERDVDSLAATSELLLDTAQLSAKSVRGFVLEAIRKRLASPEG